MPAAERYRIEGVIAEGRTAEVLLATALGGEGFERRVALKRLLLEAAKDEAFVEAFIDEARIGSRLHHANIVGVLDFGLMDGAPFLVLEHVDGVDAGRLLARAGRVPIAVALHIATEIGHALAHAHEAEAKGLRLGIVHRDVKPGNILLSKGGDVKLADFGIARAAERLTRTVAGVAKGTLGYMAPEQALSADVDARADLFALGCVLHALIAGRTPFASEEAQRRFAIDRALTLDPDLPSDVASVIERATRYERHERYPSAKDLIEETGRCLARRIDRDPRSELIDLLRAHVDPPEPRPFDPFDVARLLEDGPVPRYWSVAREEITETTSPGSLPAARDASLTGKVERQYRIGERIGQGGMAEVYRATHVTLERVYAFKVLRRRIASASLAKRFEREAKLLSMIDHPNVVTVHDCGVSESGRPFVVMELLEGELLRDVVKAGPLESSRAIRIALEIARGLGAAHACGIVHRDLKPGNIMLVRAGDREVVKILDFGIGRALDEHGAETRLTSAEHLLGTPSFMAPEQIRSAASAGPSSDLYALGAVIYAMITGRPPFVGSRQAILEQKLARPPEPAPHAGGLGSIAEALLAKDPADRPPTAAVEARIAALERGDSVEVAGRTVTRLLEPRRDRTPWLPIALVLAAGLLGAALLSSMRPHERSEERVEPPPSPPSVVASPRLPPPEPEPRADPEPLAIDAGVARRPRGVASRVEPVAATSDEDLLDVARSRGIEVGDLGADPAAAEALDRWRATKSADALAGVATHADRVAGDPGVLERKLDAIAAALAKAGAADLEDRYLDLRARELSAKTEVERRAIMLEAHRLGDEARRR
jgi:serine/threonine-protein kinase